MKNEVNMYKEIDLTKDPDEIAKFLDDNGNPEKLSSMTNNTYKITVNGNNRVIRLPGVGTDKFIKRSREEFMIRHQAVRELSPAVVYHSNDGINVTKYLNPKYYHSFSKDDPMQIPAALLCNLHRMTAVKPDTNNIIVNSNKIDLIEELDWYKEVYDNSDVKIYDGFEEFGNIIRTHLANTQHMFMVMCHRDLMYNNIMIGNDDKHQPKLIDWEYSGYLNFYWDLACFISEFNLWLNEDHDINPYPAFIGSYVQMSGMNVDILELASWRCIVDYVWAAWSLAKTALGEDNYEYGLKRFNNCKLMNDKVGEFINAFKN